jgi:multiple sugar transport system permease protein
MKTLDPERLRAQREEARRIRGRRELRRALVKHVLLILASFGMLYPLLWMIASSFKPESEIFGNLSLIPETIVTNNYVDGWTALRVSFTTFYTNSFLIAILAVVADLMACSLTAYAFARLEFRFKNLWFALMLGTLMLPYHVTLVPQYVLFQTIGWVDTFLPLVVPKFLAVDAFFIFLMVQFFRGIPREIDEAARMDGCGPWRIYWRIMLPLSTPVMATAAIFSFIWTYDNFLGPLIYLNDINLYTVPLALRAFVDSSGLSAWGQLFAMSTLSLVPLFLFFLFFQRLIIRGVATSAMKR